MQKQKLRLDELKVDSFVTSTHVNHATIVGAAGTSAQPGCVLCLNNTAVDFFGCTLNNNCAGRHRDTQQQCTLGTNGCAISPPARSWLNDCGFATLVQHNTCDDVLQGCQQTQYTCDNNGSACGAQTTIPI